MRKTYQPRAEMESAEFRYMLATRVQRARAFAMKKPMGTKYRLEIRESEISGRGLFALEDIPWGKKIKQYAGKIISDKQAQKRAKEGATAIMELDEDKNIDGFDDGNGAAYANHNRENPNCFLLRQKDKIWLVAGIEGIKAGQELTYDYGSDYYKPRKISKK
jgi:SET domain-containing protein